MIRRPTPELLSSLAPIRRPAAPSARIAIVAAVALTLTGGRAAAQTAPPPTVEPAPGTTALTYRLNGDSFDVPYSGKLARVRMPMDVSSGPDGTVFVLDSDALQQMLDGPGNADPIAWLHVLAADGTELQRIDVTPWIATPKRLDVGVDGSIAILGSSQPDFLGVSRVVLLGPDRRFVDDWDLRGRSSSDVAVLPDGRIAVAEADGITLLSPAGAPTRRVALSSLPIDVPADGRTYSPRRLDAARDGRITVLVVARWHCNRPTSPPRPTGTARPTPTPRPSLASLVPLDHTLALGAALARPDGPAQEAEVCLQELALTLRPDITLEATQRLTYAFDDLAVHDGTVFAPWGSPDGEVLRVVDIKPDGPSVSYPLAKVLPDGRPRTSGGPLTGGARDISIDVAPDGSILTVWRSGDVFTTGPVRLGVPGQAGTNPIALAYGDVPALTGPVRPRAVAAGPDGLAVLDGAYTLTNPAPWTVRNVDVQGRRNAVQRWTLDGRLVGQWVHMGTYPWSFGSSALGGTAPGTTADDRGAPEDIALVGDRLYTATPGGIWLRTDIGEPAWFSGVPGIRLIAVDADETDIVAFDAAGSRVLVWAPDGRLTDNWTVRADGRAVAASDLTVGGGHVFIADTGRNRVLVRSLAGDDLGEWRTHDGPQRLDRTADGDLVILGRGGWGLRYTADGALRAAWRMPGATGAKRTEGTDIAAGPDGSVYVTYSRVKVGSEIARLQDVLEAAGIWRFAMSVPPPATLPPSPDPQHCLVDVDKTASPGRVALGHPVTVTLTAAGECPRVPLPAQIVFVVDTSWSMNDGYEPKTAPGALDRARSVLIPLLGALDPAVVDVGLVTFGDGAALQSVLSDDIADLRGRILRAQADGDTRMGAGVDLAHAELNGPRRVPGARRSIVIVSDGVFKDDPRPAVEAARADGIDVHALVVSTPEFSSIVRAALVRLLGADHVTIDPSPDRARAVIDAIGSWQIESDLFETLTVRDVIPANMRFVPGSAAPPAAWDAATRTLAWTLPPRPLGQRVALTYAVVPEEEGTWPTNVEADATWWDVRGGAGQLAFPVPRVEVFTTTRLYLPFTARAACSPWRRPIDLVLVHDTSSSMGLPAADARRTKLDVAVEAARLFVARLDPLRDRVAVIAFDAEARVVAPLSADIGVAAAALAALRPREGTRIDRGLQRATEHLTDSRRPTALPVVVLLSDGLQGGSVAPVRAVLPALRALGARVYAIGYGEAHNDALLREIAGDADGYRYAPSVEDLQAVYDGIGETLLCP